MKIAVFFCNDLSLKDKKKKKKKKSLHISSAKPPNIPNLLFMPVFHFQGVSDGVGDQGGRSKKKAWYEQSCGNPCRGFVLCLYLYLYLYLAKDMQSHVDR